MIGRAAMLLMGVPIAAAGLGLTAAFGVFAFIGLPLMAVGLGMISAAITPDP